MKRPLILFLLMVLLVACLPGQPAPVVKVGLLVPLEGERRLLGYHLLPAIRATTPESLRDHRIEWVILDTQGDPRLAAQRAEELLVDPALLVIVGPLLPEEVEEVAPLVEQAGIAWWPLAPRGEAGVRGWLAGATGAYDPRAAWGARAWPALRRGQLTEYFDPQLPADLGDFPSTGEPPWPQDWLAWQAARHAFAAMEAANKLEREAIRAVATPLILPAPARYISRQGEFPGSSYLED